MSAIPAMVFIGGLIGATLAADPSLSTMPVALLVVGTACATIPASLMQRKLGRKWGGVLGIAIGVIGCLISAFAIFLASFTLFLIGSICLGAMAAFVQQFRFAALDSLDDPSRSGTALSVLMLSGVVAAFLGPEVVSVSRHWWVDSYEYFASYILLAILLIIASGVLLRLKEPEAVVITQVLPPRGVGAIFGNPHFLFAVLSGVCAYGVMSFIMTATPLSMHHIEGHSLDAAKRVIQSHIAAMFLPALISGYLLDRFGTVVVMLAGLSIFLAAVCFGMLGQEILHYWWALLLLGLGWNWLFMGATNYLPRSYRHEERHKVQAVNDFIIFSTQAVASLSAGWVLLTYGWNTLLLICIPLILITWCFAAGMLVWNKRANTQLKSG